VDEDREIADVRAEESSRGRRQPKRLMTSDRKRRIERAARMLAEATVPERSSWKLFASSGIERDRRSLMIA
jgi:hypothetical protein